MAIFTPKMIRWLSRNVPGKTFNETAPVFNAKFGTELAPGQIRWRCNRLGIKSGVTKGYRLERGYRVGDECIPDKKRDCTVYVKVAEGRGKNNGANRNGTWRRKHFVVWETANGPLPQGCHVIFADGDKGNFDINNLLLVSRREYFFMNKNGMFSNDPDVTKTNLLITKHRLLIFDKVYGLAGKKSHYSVENNYRRWEKSSKQGRGGKNGN